MTSLNKDKHPHSIKFIEADNYLLTKGQKARWHFLMAFSIYLLLSLIYFAPSSLHQLSSAVFNNGGDPEQFIWYYNWWPFALVHHHNLFVSKYVWNPTGYNFSWSTSIPFLGFLMMPVTLLGGAVLSFNIFALLSPVLAAFSGFCLIYYITKRFLPSLLSGYIFGFSSFEIAQLLGHPQQYAIFLLPILILLYLALINNSISHKLYIVLSSLTFVFLVGTSLEIATTFSLFSIISLVCFYWLSASDRQRILSSLKYIACSLLLSLVLLSYFIYYLISGYHNLPKEIHPLIPFSTNLANTFIPTPLTLVGGQALTFLSRYFTANNAENGAYLGIPMLLILAYITYRHWQNKRLRALVTVFILIVIASLGPRLHIIGQFGTKIIMPWAIVTNIPLINAAQPDRFSLYFFLIAAILIGIWLSYSSRNRKFNYLKLLAVLVAIVAIMPSPKSYYYQTVSVPKVFQKPYVAKYLANQPNVLILPFDGSSTYYQYASGMAFTQAGGYVGFIPKQYASNPVISALKSNSPSINFSIQLQTFCNQNNISKIIYINNLMPSNMLASIRSLNWPMIKIGNVFIFSNPKI
jgi:hypothetical protein